MRACITSTSSGNLVAAIWQTDHADDLHGRAHLHDQDQAGRHVRRAGLHAARRHRPGCGLRDGTRPRPQHQTGPSWGGGYLFPIKGASEFAAGKAKSVSGIKVLDPSTLQITLTQPTTTFIYDLTIATSWPVPKEAVRCRATSSVDSPVGAGPFYLDHWNKGQSMVLKANPGYVDPTFPYLDELDISLNVDPNTQVLQLQDGTIDARPSHSSCRRRRSNSCRRAPRSS